MSPLERAARALWQLDQQPEPIAPGMAVPDSADWTSYIPRARAVIEAIREPSDAMLAVDVLRPDGCFFPEDHWKAMIDVALQDG